MIWGFLVAVLVALVTATAIDRLRRPEPPPVLDPVPAFRLTNRDGRAVRLGDGRGITFDLDFETAPDDLQDRGARFARRLGNGVEETGVFGHHRGAIRIPPSRRTAAAFM